MRDWLRGVGFDALGATDLLIATGEAISNAMEHAYGFSPVGAIEVAASVAGGAVVVTVGDDGSWRSPARGGVDGVDGDRGRGLRIARGLVDHLDIDSGGAGTTVRLTKLVTHAGPVHR